MNWLTKIIKAPLHGKIVPSFAEQSRPDWTFTVAGLRIGGHSDGLPIYAPGYITIGRTHDAPLPAVPEVGTAPMFGLALSIVAGSVWLRSTADGIIDNRGRR